MTAQFRLLGWARQLKPGQAVNLPEWLVRDAANAERDWLDRFVSGPNAEEVREFIHKIERHWGIELVHLEFERQYSMRKQKSRASAG